MATPTLWAVLCGNWMKVAYIQKEPIRLGFPMFSISSIYINSLSSFNTIPTPIPPHFRPEPGFDPRIDIPPSPHHHHTIAQSTSQLPLDTVSWPVALATSEHTLLGGRREGLISLSSLSETQERSIADKSAYVLIDQPNTLQRFYIPTRLAILGAMYLLGRIPIAC